MAQKTSEEIAQQNQTLVEHLTDLRYRLVRCAWAVLIGLIICYNFTNEIFDILRSPILPYLSNGGLIFTAPMDKFIAHLKIAFFGGLILSFPVWLFQIWQFISPGLYSKEKKYGVGFILAGTIQFLLGVLFSYFVVFPMAFKFLMNYGGDIDKPMITIDQYMSFVTTTSFMFGLAFELPIILITLGLLGFVSSTFLKEKRRYAYVGLAAVSAVITPPDLLSMLMMFVPMLFLYEISLFFVGFFEKKKTRQSIE